MMNDRRIDVPWNEWEVVERIGRGQFGTVYKLSRTKFGITEYAAMKVISIPEDQQLIENDLNYGYDKESVRVKYKSYLDEIIREYQLMKTVKACPNIVRCDDISMGPHDDGIGWDVYILMEYLNPCPFLKNRKNPITDDMVIKLGLDICNALSMCEKNNILHRDIKPSNILYSDVGDYKLGDFGVSRTLANENTYGTKGIGTYEYMAPEIYKGDKYGQGADIYSLGMVMYWLLNGRSFPFLEKGKAPTSQQQERARVRRFGGEPIPEPSGGSTELKKIVLKALEYNPRYRYKNADEMMTDLKQLGKSVYVEVPKKQRRESKKEDKAPVNTNDSWHDDSATVGKDYHEKQNIDFADTPTVGKYNNKDSEVSDDNNTREKKKKTGKSHEKASKKASKKASQKVSANAPMKSYSAKKENSLCMIGLLLSIFLTGISGLIVSIIGLVQVKRDHSSGKSRAIIGIIISLIKLFMIFVFVMEIFSYVERSKTSRAETIQITQDDEVGTELIDNLESIPTLSMPTAIPTPSPTVNSTPNLDEFYEFVITNGYQDILGRSPDDQGFSEWRERLSSGAYTVEQMYREMFNSPEYLAAGTSNEEYIESLFNLLKDNGAFMMTTSWWNYIVSEVEPYYIEELNDSTSRSVILDRFFASNYWQDVLDVYNKEYNINCKLDVALYIRQWNADTNYIENIDFMGQLFQQSGIYNAEYVNDDRHYITFSISNRGNRFGYYIMLSDGGTNVYGRWPERYMSYHEFDSGSNYYCMLDDMTGISEGWYVLTVYNAYTDEIVKKYDIYISLS